jgi:hypothetical protein
MRLQAPDDNPINDPGTAGSGFGTAPGYDGAPALATGPGKLRAWWRAGKAVWILVIVALVSLAAGFGIARLIRSPAELAAETAVPPEGLITARIEAREITSTVVARADVIFDDPIQINPSSPEGTTAAIVTGQVPEIGAQVGAGDVILEVSGRPVFVLPGEFPGFRSMGPGTSGPDVIQLRKALATMGFNTGNAEDKNYDSTLAAAVKALYDKAGYDAPGSGDRMLTQAVRDARDGLTDAKDARTQANKTLDSAKKALAQAADAESKAQAQEAVDAARSALEMAGRSVERAEEGLAEAERAAWTTMPLGELVFVADLPRRVDQVNVKIGDDASNIESGNTDFMTGATTATAAVVLSGAELKVTAQVNSDEATLLEEGGPAMLTVDATEVAGQITSICPEEDNPGGLGGTPAGTCEVGITVTDMAGLNPETMAGNVLVTMLVGTSSADSLVVPLAAVSADTAGNARIEIVEGELVKDKAGADQPTRIVSIETGLTAEGMVEIKTADSELKAGDLVVIGQGRQAEDSTDSSSEAPGASGAELWTGLVTALGTNAVATR